MTNKTQVSISKTAEAFDKWGKSARRFIIIITWLSLLTIAGPALANWSLDVSATVDTDGGEGSFTINPDLPSYSDGESVTLTAIPNRLRDYFNGWYRTTGPDDFSRFSNPLTFIMKSNRGVEVDFKKFGGQLTYLKNISQPCSRAQSPCAVTWARPEVVRRDNNDPIITYNNTLYSGAPAFFDEDGNLAPDLFFSYNNGLAFYKNPDTSVTYLLTVKKVGGSGTATSSDAGINCGWDCWELYRAGASVTLFATADNGSTFDGWSVLPGVNAGTCINKTSPCSISMTQNKTITATFSKLTTDVPIVYKNLAVEKNGTGVGTVTTPGINCGLNCEKNYILDTVVPVTANPALGSIFARWSVACTGQGPCDLLSDTCAGATINPCNVKMNSDKTVTATFNNNDTPFVPGPDDTYTCPANHDINAGWQAPKYPSPQCFDNSAGFDLGCYPPINGSDIPQNKTGCLSVGTSTTNNLIDLVVDAGAYVRGFLKLPLGLSQQTLPAKIGNILTLTDATTTDGVLDGTAGWGSLALTCENVTTEIQPTAEMWKSATSTCSSGFKVVGGGINASLGPNDDENYLYTESYPDYLTEAWVGRLRSERVGALVFARCCR